MAVFISELVSLFGKYASLMFSLEIVSGVSLGSVIIALTVLTLILNLLSPVLKSDIRSGNSKIKEKKISKFEENSKK